MQVAIEGACGKKRKENGKTDLEVQKCILVFVAQLLPTSM